MNGAWPSAGERTRIDLAREAPFSLGGMDVRPSSREIVVAGKSQVLQPRVMQVLVALARQEGQVVSRDDLVARCWDGLAVSEDAINRCIAQLRRLSEQDGPFTLETIPRVGYRIVSAAAVRGPEELVPPQSREVPIAVLPFANLSSDPEQEYFSDGITDDIITDLTRWPLLAVTSRNSTFRFKGQAIDAQQMGRDLNVRFLVEGSVRRIGDRVRIGVQLTDTGSGTVMWAERYDCPVKDLFAVQDEMVRTIVGTLVGRVRTGDAQRLSRKPPANFTAYDLTLKGNTVPASGSRSAAAEAVRCFEQAIALDPGYALPHSLLAIALCQAWSDSTSRPSSDLGRAHELAKRSVELDEGDSTSHVALAYCLLLRRAFDSALSHVERAVEINPANPWILADLGHVLIHLGRPEEGMNRMIEARRRDPFYGPDWYWRALGLGKFVARRHAEALDDLERRSAKGFFCSALEAACRAELGQAERARELVGRCLAREPSATAGEIANRIPFQRREDSEHLVQCLLRAGMPA